MIAVRQLSVVALVLVLAGCQATYSKPRSYGVGARSEFNYAAVDNDFRIEVIGNPTGGAKSELDDIAADVFQRAYANARTRFTTTPGPSEVKPYKVVVMFDPPLGMAADEVCGAPPPVPEPTADKTRILTVFCGHSILGEMSATIAKVTTLADGRIAETLNQMAWLLIRDRRIHSFDQ